MQSDYLSCWNAEKEQQKAVFMEHMYQCSGRHQKAHPMHGLYTGLWHEFCLGEAGEYCRNLYFERLKAVKEFEDQQQKAEEVFMPTLHD